MEVPADNIINKELELNQFKPEGFSEEIFKLRYAFTETETWPEACERVATQMAKAENPDKQGYYKEKFKNILESNLFVPGGRIWYNSGRVNPQLLNCFVLDHDLDSKEGWGNISKEMIITSMTGGGCGIDFNEVRPNGASINQQRGECPGPIALMELVNNNGNPVRAGGSRRVALMFSLLMTHPDVLEFIDAKLTHGKLQLANISVRSLETTKFIQAVKEDGDWELNWKGLYKKTIKARELWNKIVQNAYNSAEPGFLNWELVESESNIYYIEPLITTNPCFTGDTTLLTSEGYKTFSEIKDKTVKLVNHRGEVHEGTVWSNGIKDIVSVKNTLGEEIKCTPDHRFMLIDETECRAEDLKGKRLRPLLNVRTENDHYTKLGFIQGDGGLGRIDSESHKGLEVNIGEKDQEMALLFNIKYEVGKRFYYINGFNEELRILGFDSSRLPERTLPTTFTSWESSDKLSFLRGLYSANGCVISGKRISFKTTCNELALQLSESLNEFGMSNYITTNKPKQVEFSNGRYLCKESYDVNITQYNSVKIFAKLIGFVHEYKNASLKDLLVNNSPMIVSVKAIGQEEVFDFNLQDETHWGVVGEGYIAHNCGEIAMSSYDACCLGHLVLTRFVKGSDVDWHLLAETVRTGVRFLDNALTVNHFPLPEMKDKTSKLRRIGLGTTGLADLLALVGHKYGDEESLKFIEKLYKFISKTAYEASVMLAVEKGKFPLCDPKKHVKSGFMKRMSSKIKSMVEEHGIRNCAILTQAPTGTVSILSGNVSSGIEPMFAPAYERRFWSGEERKTELVLHPLFKKFMDEGKSVEHFVGSRDLSVRNHLEVQKIIQKYVDNAVSKTINIPQDYPIEDMEALWLEYLPHLKGTTFYRENTRGYVKEDGTIEEPPLKALSLDEAKSKYSAEAQVGKDDNDCVGGMCEL